MNMLLDSTLNSTIVMMATMEGGTVTMTPSKEITVEQDTSKTDTDETKTETDETNTDKDETKTDTDETKTDTDETETGDGETDTDETDTGTEGTGGDTQTPAVDDQTGQDVSLDEAVGEGLDVVSDAGMTDGMVMGEDLDMGTTKDPFLASWTPVIGISGATILLGLVIGFLLARKKIKKGFEIYED